MTKTMNAPKPMKLTNKSYTSVSEMVRGTTDKAFADQFDQHLSGRMIVRQLTVLRCTQGLSQAEIARKIGCSQGKISKFEASSDKDISFGDLADYVIALGRGLKIIITAEAANAVSVEVEGEDGRELPAEPPKRVHRPRKKEAVNS
jgi:transcriptional regulator with XRE-family HTH domain